MSPAETIRNVAARQHGVVARTQLLELGASGSSIGRSVKSGRLRPMHGGVYLVGPLEPARAAEMAAVLAGGPSAALSHTSALRLWGMLRIAPPRPVHVSVPGSGRGLRPGIVFHRVAALDDEERTILDGIRITSPARTIVDAAGMLGLREIELALATAEREGLIGGEELSGLPHRYTRRPGMAMIRALLAEHTGPHLTRSEAERRCLEVFRTAGLPRPHANVPMGPYELDLFWPAEGIAIEIDGRAHHSSRRRFEGDRRKDGWLRGRGVEVIRLSWRQITREPTATAVQVGQALALARARRVRAARGGVGPEAPDVEPAPAPARADDTRRFAPVPTS